MNITTQFRYNRWIVWATDNPEIHAAGKDRDATIVNLYENNREYFDDINLNNISESLIVECVLCPEKLILEVPVTMDFYKKIHKLLCLGWQEHVNRFGWPMICPKCKDVPRIH